VAYYRHSAQDRQENSVEIQREQVHTFAAENAITIVREFADRGISGLSVEGRDGFNEMLNEYVVGGKEDFEYVLVLDVSRWGRFQETDLSAYYTGLCLKHGKRVVFTSIGMPKDDDLLHGLHMSIERYRAASYSRELSGKVFKGCAKIAGNGYWAGGKPPYAMCRLLLDESRHPVRVLKHGEHKAIHNQRVTLVPGDEREVDTVREIYRAFTEDGTSPEAIAERLNHDGTPAPSERQWNRSSVTHVLQNEIYAGVMVWNKTTQRMKSPTRLNPREDWIRKPDAFEPVVPMHVFEVAQEALRAQAAERLRRYSAEDMTARLRAVYERYGVVSSRIIAADGEMVSPSAYASHFGSVDLAFQAMFKEVIEQRASEVIELLRDSGAAIAAVDDFVVVDGAFSIRVQPSVPMPSGYEVYWAFHPHQRQEIDLTIGVPLSVPEDCGVLGYLALPRMMFQRRLRISSSRPEDAELYACHLFELMEQLRR